MILHTLGAPAPEGATTLFDGSSLAGWEKRGGGPAGWKIVEGGALEVVPGAGDICTFARFADHYLHLEFMVSDMPEATGQARANSGVFIQGRYEIQVLDSYGWEVPGYGDCGSLYDQFAPLVNACLPPMTWQNYDVIFRAPRCEGKVVRERARMTVFHNGQIIHNNIEIPHPTGAPSDLDIQQPGHLRLQDHSNLIWFRNIWAVPLEKEGSNQYGPR